ncbi:GGDEF domain-containing protein [Aeromonas salmonicida]|uniref:GGDEF domain-containing protein n=1 Tax=Aeromonas salmonicida TaxID=645 RepID=UPI001EDCFC8D|nr:GGDEF domain-containing protein [Aeromonas salmonicida]
MLRGKFLSLILMVTTFLGVAIWSVWNYDRAFNAVTRYTQLSAWALAQLELEIHAFDEALLLYRAGAVSQEEMNKRFDIAWNRLDVFLHGEEARSVRERFGAGKAAGKIMTLFEQYEQDVMSGGHDSSPLAHFSDELSRDLVAIRDVMVKNFTGPSAIAQRELLNDSRTQNFAILAFLMLATMVMLLVLFREVRHQHFLAWNDTMTGLPNRAALIKHLKHLKQRAAHRGGGRSITVCVVDLGHFREVNDSLGYEIGDALLKQLAERIRNTLTAGIFVARTGSDEFAIVISGVMPTYLPTCVSRFWNSCVVSLLSWHLRQILRIGCECSWASVNMPGLSIHRRRCCYLPISRSTAPNDGACIVMSCSPAACINTICVTVDCRPSFVRSSVVSIVSSSVSTISRLSAGKAL